MVKYSIKDDKIGNISMFIGIPLIGFVLTFVFGHKEFELFTYRHLIAIFMSISITAVNWIGCRIIVTKLWNDTPWHLKPLRHLFIEIPSILMFVFCVMSIDFYLYSKYSSMPLCWDEFWKSTFVILLLTSFLVAYHEAIFFYKQWQENFNKSTILEKANLQAEYDQFVNQVNPHFLFNSLNTLASYVDDNPTAVKYVNTLADFLRYSLMEKKKSKNSLKEELEMAMKYVELQKYRYGDDLIVKVEIMENDLEYFIPTLALQMLVENAIKHNIISKSKPLRINISVENTEYLVVENNLQLRNDASTIGLGLNNLTRRLDYLSDKKMMISKDNGMFTVRLPMIK